MKAPLSTYRLQIRQSFDLDAAADVIGYLTALGADWVYLSPLLTAEPGSDHGYDVVDPSAVDPARGGEDGLVRFSSAARAADRGVLVDIVPNHMGVATPSQNAWWWDVLTYGRASRYAEAFDIDWEAGAGRLRVPVLGDDDGEGDGELDRLEYRDGALWYHDNRYPVAPGTADDGSDARTVHSRQHYELVNWRVADAGLTYRRFFAVNTLAAVRVEVPWVFAESHAEILRWIRDGLVDGLRIDHPDGLADPGAYLEAVREATGGCYVLVEKILEGGERLPAHWSAAGTTGYDALGDVDRVLVDPSGESVFDDLEARLHSRASEEHVVWHDLVHESKRRVADGILRSEVLRLARAATVAGADDALAELLACFPVYRSYLPVGIEHLNAAADEAKRRRPDLSDVIDRLVPLLADPGHPVSVRFQQTSGMVMAKGVEDTAYYRYSRLTMLNEVGADPGEFAIDVGAFHARQAARQAGFPLSMTTLSTHDTKRAEDVRARIAVLSEIAPEWAEAFGELNGLQPIGDPPFAKLLWEAIVGSWPASTDRLRAYAEKAAREAGTSTTWTEPDERFEQRLRELVDAVGRPGPVRSVVESVVGRVRDAGWSNSLSAKLIHLTAPGVPDVYQGSELWETSLVDPDNRRPVDFALRRESLARIDGGWLPPVDETGAVKLLVTSRALRARRDHPGWFSRYLPVPAFGAAAGHVVAFDRGEAITVATRLPIRLERVGGWRDTTVMLPHRPLIDLITGESHGGGPTMLHDLTRRYPVALLAPRVGERP
ncbi:malto-oligosyltrehalose synthase [Okibacterium endophyticum]